MSDKRNRRNGRLISRPHSDGKERTLTSLPSTPPNVSLCQEQTFAAPSYLEAECAGQLLLDVSCVKAAQLGCGQQDHFGGGVRLMNTPSPDRFVRLPDVLKRTGLSRATLYRKVQAGTFPRQVRIATRCVGWRQSAIDQWLANPMFYTVDDYA